MTKNSEVITAFVKASMSNDIDELMSFFAPDAVYTNVPIPPPHVGIDAIRETLSSYYSGSSQVELRIHNQAESESGVVMNERLDRILAGDKWIELPVVGVFEISDGKIIRWSDYFDVGQLSAQM